MNYSEAFKSAVLAAHPDDSRIHNLLAEGNCGQLGYLLRLAAERDITPGDITRMISDNDCEGLMKRAQALIRHKKVYSQWCEIHDRYCPSR